MPAGHHGVALGILATAVTVGAVLAGTTGQAAAVQNTTGRAFGPGHCGPIDPSYVRGATATGGQIFPLGPTEIGTAAPLIAASPNAETVFWATAALASRTETITVPVDGLTSRVAFVLSTDGSITDMTVSDPRGTLITARPGVDAFSFGCVRGFVVERPVAGEWTVRVAGAGTYWFVVHARSDLRLDDAAFVQLAGRLAHEGLFKIRGEPVAGRPATLRAHVTREDVIDATFDLVSMSGEHLQTIELSPVTASSAEEEYVGEIANLPSIPFRVRVSGRDRTGAVYQRVSPRMFRTATVEVVAPQTVNLARGQRTPVTVSVRSVGAPARLQIVAVLDATVLRVEPTTVQLSVNESRDVTVWADVPANGTPRSPEIVVTAESPTDPAAANSTIIRATLLDPVR
jgi:von Willebrand factor A domain-containing protein 7